MRVRRGGGGCGRVPVHPGSRRAGGRCLHAAARSWQCNTQRQQLCPRGARYDLCGGRFGWCTGRCGRRRGSERRGGRRGPARVHVLWPVRPPVKTHTPTHAHTLQPCKDSRNSAQPCTAVPRCSARCAAGLNRVPTLHWAFPRTVWSPVRVLSSCLDAPRCRRALLTGHATCDFVFDTAAVRVLRAMAGVVPAPAGALGELAFEACSLGLGNVSVASGSCFTYDLVRATA